MKIISPLIFIVIFLGVGCDNYHSRDCDAFYYDYNNWQPIDENETITFISANNDEVSFKLMETYLSEPYTEGYIGGNCCDNEPETVVCNMTGIFIYNSEDLGIDLKIEFWQRESFEQPIEEQTINYGIAFKEELDSIFVSLHGFQIEPDYNSINSIHSTFDSIVLNNNTYYDIIQSEIDSSSTNINDNIFYWKLIGSRGKGIIYLEDKQGNIYYLKE